MSAQKSSRIPPGSDLQLVKGAVKKEKQLPQAQIEQGSSELIICPRKLRPLVIEKFHTQHHAEIGKSYPKIRREWFWPRMQLRLQAQSKLVSFVRLQNTKTTRYLKELEGCTLVGLGKLCFNRSGRPIYSKTEQHGIGVVGTLHQVEGCNCYT